MPYKRTESSKALAKLVEATRLYLDLAPARCPEIEILEDACIKGASQVEADDKEEQQATEDAYNRNR